MAGSFTLAAFLVILDMACFISFWVIKTLRKLTDLQMVANRRLHDATDETADSDAVGETNNGNDDNDTCGDLLRCGKVLSIGKACLLDNTSMTPNVTERFPDWEPLPSHCGIITMLVLLVVSTVLLTPRLLLDHLGMVSSSSSLQFCEAVDGGIEWHVAELKAKLVYLTRVEEARFEYQYTEGFRAALASDVLLYGEENYECGDSAVSSEKREWEATDQTTNFFTGWCEKQLADELEASTKLTTTIPEECNSVTVEACVDGWGFSWFCRSAEEEVCVGPTTYPSPDAGAVDRQIELAKYQMEVERLERRRLESSVDPEIDDLVDDIAHASAEISKELKYQVDVASYLYILYLWVAAFFPSPIILFRSSPVVQFKRLVFGMRKETFILAVLSLWWGYRYFKAFAIDPSVQLYLANLSANPCYVDPDFVKAKHQEISNVCSELEIMRVNRTRSLEEIEQTLFKAEFMLDNCDCNIPDQSLREYMFLPASGSGIVSSAENDFLPEWVSGLGMKARNAPYFKKIGEGWSKHSYLFYLPEKDSPFIGNTTVCTNGDYQTEQLHKAPDSGASWFHLWISSGMLAGLFTKIVAANFCVSLLKSADPLGSINGMYERPAREYFATNTENMVELQKDKTLVLKTIAIRGCVVWGALIHLLILNLVIVSITDDDTNTLDIILGSVSLFIAFIAIPCIGFLIMRVLNVKIQEAEWNSLSLVQKLRKFWSHSYHAPE